MADQPVGEPGVLGQQGTVEVGADDAALSHALDARGAGVAVALEHAPERLLARPKVRAAAVVLEAGEHPRLGGGTVEAYLDRDVADQARAVGRADRLEVDEAESRDLLRAELVAVAEQLIAAADSEHERAAAGGRMQRLALGRHEVQRAEALIAVLA